MISVDPGVRGAGVAVFERSELLWAGYFKTPMGGRGYKVADSLATIIGRRMRGNTGPVIIEYPVIYPGMPQKDLNDLIDVAVAGACISVELAPNAFDDGGVRHVFPSEWKGNVKKQVMLERIRSKLTPEESARVEWTNKSDNEDILDAIGIGLWHFKRLNSKSYPGAT